MNRKLKYLLLVIGLILVVGQFVKPKQNISTEMSKDDITKHYAAPNKVEHLLQKACRDCHSNNTVYPKYANFFPVSWYIYNHVYGGKKKLDFSMFATYDKEEQIHKMVEIKEVLEEGSMPLSSYELLHSEARLTEKEIRSLSSWCDVVISQIEK